MATHGIGVISSWLAPLLTGSSSTPAMNPSSASPSPPPPPPPPTHHQDEPQQKPTPGSLLLRQTKQFSLLLAGAGFLAASVAVARRSVLRQRLTMHPPFYASNRNPLTVSYADRQSLAARALGLATLNVMSFGVMLVGGISWAFDISSLEELRARTRVALERPTGMTDEEEKEAERQMEEAMDGLLAKLGMKRPESETEGEGEAEGQKEPTSDESVIKADEGTD